MGGLFIPDVKDNKNYLELDYNIGIDLRENKNRYDDLIFVVTKR